MGGLPSHTPHIYVTFCLSQAQELFYNLSLIMLLLSQLLSSCLTETKPPKALGDLTPVTSLSSCPTSLLLLIPFQQQWSPCQSWKVLAYFHFLFPLPEMLFSQVFMWFNHLLGKTFPNILILNFTVPQHSLFPTLTTIWQYTIHFN